MTQEHSACLQYVTFTVAGHHFGVAALDVQEVLREQRVTPVPLAHAAIQGLINLRGQVVPAINMRELLRLAPREEKASPPSVVVRTEDGPICLQVDVIGDVLELEPSSYEPPPISLDDDLLALVRGVHKLEGQLLLVLDARRAAFLGTPEQPPQPAEMSA